MSNDMLRVFDGDGKALAAGDSDLTQAEVDFNKIRTVVTRDVGDMTGWDDSDLVDRVWILAEGATFDCIPPAERHVAWEILRTDRAVFLLSNDRRAEDSVRCGLMDLIDLDDAPQERCGHA